jgi:predicted metal-dependent phosphoesterase TrpH
LLRAGEREGRIRAMVAAAERKGLDFFVNSDHAVNTSGLTQRVANDLGARVVVVPGFEAAPPSLNPAVNHVVVAGVPPGSGVVLPRLQALRALVTRHGGVLVCAHPVGGRWLRQGARLGFFDAYEGLNASACQRRGLWAPGEWAYPDVGLPRVAGSDAHTAQDLLGASWVTVVDADERTPGAILGAVRAGRVGTRRVTSGAVRVA